MSRSHSPGQLASMRGPWSAPTGWRWIDGKLYAPRGVAGFADMAQRKADRLRAEKPELSVRVVKERDGAGFTWKLFQEVPAC